MANDFRYGIIGAGKLGLSLADALNHKSYLEWVIARNDKSIDWLLNHSINLNLISRKLSSNLNLPDVIIIAVNDSEIESVTKELFLTFGTNLKGKIIFHCSGLYGNEILSELKSLGTFTFAAHPFQTFYYPSGKLFNNIYWGVSKSTDFNLISIVVENIGGKAIELDQENESMKAIYHASAVVSSNIVTSVIQFSKMLALHSNTDLKFLPELIRTTIDNSINGLNKEDIPLTGPVARQDINTVKMHLEALKISPELLDIYINLTRAVMDISFLSGVIDINFKTLLNELLDKYKNNK